MDFVMPPPTPGVEGTVIALQAYVAPVLSNPATLPLDAPYLVPSEAFVLTSPNPQVKGEFGKYATAGDLNGDGYMDLVIAAHKEDFLGIDMSGRVYVHWGPDFQTVTTLSPPAPVVAGFFGIGLVVADLDGVPPDDLVVANTAGDPAPAGNPARLHVYFGAPSFPTTPSLTILSPETGTLQSSYGYGSVAGDFDDDGSVDLAVPHPKATVSGLSMAGRLDIHWGPAFVTHSEIVSPLPQANAKFGAVLAAVDVNGDGVVDVVEASGSTPLPPWTLVGSAHVFVNPGFVLAHSIPCPEPLGTLTGFGLMLAVGDATNDDLPDLVISDAQDRTFLFRSPDYATYSIIPKPPAIQVNPFGESAYGYRLDVADINGDGVADLLISDEFEGDEVCPISAGGRVFGVLAPYFAVFHSIEDKTPTCGDEFGGGVIALELDGDESSELMVGAMFADDFGLVSSGHATILGDGDG
jgi:hypothetical protein